jgi:hypothetical protein
VLPTVRPKCFADRSPIIISVVLTHVLAPPAPLGDLKTILLHLL